MKKEIVIECILDNDSIEMLGSFMLICIKKFNSVLYDFCMNHYCIRSKINIIKFLIDNNMHHLISRKTLRIIDINKVTYDDIVDLIDHIHYNINVYVKPIYELFPSYINDDFDVTTNKKFSELLFTVNFNDQNEQYEQTYEYYGSKFILYNSISTFDVISSNGIEKENGLHLVIQQPKHVFDEYIRMHHIGQMNIKNWGLDDIIHLIDLNDMYPSKIVTMEILESHLINIINNSDVTNEHMIILRELCARHKSVRLLVTLNNIKLLLNISKNLTDLMTSLNNVRLIN
jgi:hypothetical protein